MDKRCGLPLALPLHAKKLYQGLPLPGGEKEAQAAGQAEVFSPHSNVSSSKFSFFKKSLFRRIERDLWLYMKLGWRSPGCTAWSGMLFLPAGCWRGRYGGHLSGDISVVASPPCVFLS